MKKELKRMDPKIKKNLDFFLRPDEKVLWHGKTRSFGITEGKEGKRVLLQWVLSAVCIFGFLALVLAYGNATATVIGLLMLLLVILVVAPILSYRGVLTQEYFITDQRVLLIKPDGAANAIERGNVDDCRLVRTDFGGEALVIGSGLFPEGDKQLRWRALHPKLGRYAKSNDGLTIAEGLVFYHVTDGEQAAQMLRQTT